MNRPRYDRNLSGLDPGTDFEISCQARAVTLYRQDPESGYRRLVSAETDPETDQSLPIMNLAMNDQKRFIELASFLSPTVQDIFYQYYLLGRTYAQIGRVLFPDKTIVASEITVKRGNYFGLRAMCAVIRCGGKPTAKHEREYPEFAEAYQSMLNFQSRLDFRSLTKAKTSRDLGDFFITPNGHMAEFFPPSWSVLGPRSCLGFNQCQDNVRC